MKGFEITDRARLRSMGHADIANLCGQHNDYGVRPTYALMDELLTRLNEARDEIRRLKRPDWQPIETAPKDGTVIDLYGKEMGRLPDCYWGLEDHCCGEAGEYCDSEWHYDQKPGWVFSTLNHKMGGRGFTHWMPRPAPPISPDPAQ